jgi:protein-tyrosine-phosphatase
MENVITRIIEVEKQCADEVEKAEQEYRQKIDAYKKTIEEKKAREFELIITAEKEKLTQALDEAKKKSEADAIAERRDDEQLYQDPALNEAIKEKILSILLAT